METALRSWGNSQGIRITKEIITEMNIGVNTPLDMMVVDDKIIITKKFKHKTLKDRVEESGLPLKASEEIDWGKSVGNEVW